MKLLWSPRSPFVRKVCIVIEECGLTDQVERIASFAMLAAPPNPDILRVNPLGKIPALVIDDDETLFDSRVICEHLIARTNRHDLLPDNTRIKHLRWQALADGLIDILLLWRTERGRGDHADPVILAAFETKTRATLALLENECAALGQTRFGLGHIALICALGHLEFRYGDCRWKTALPALAQWYKAHLSRPSVAATAVIDDGAGPTTTADATPSFILGDRT